MRYFSGTQTVNLGKIRNRWLRFSREAMFFERACSSSVYWRRTLVFSIT